MTKDELIALAERVEKAGRDNRLDVAIEVARFKPNSAYTAARPNFAGTKVIYTDKAWNDVTCWAEDWTTPSLRASAIKSLRAQAQEANDAE